MIDRSFPKTRPQKTNIRSEERYFAQFEFRVITATSIIGFAICILWVLIDFLKRMKNSCGKVYLILLLIIKLFKSVRCAFITEMENPKNYFSKELIILIDYRYWNIISNHVRVYVPELKTRFNFIFHFNKRSVSSVSGRVIEFLRNIKDCRVFNYFQWLVSYILIVFHILYSFILDCLFTFCLL